MGQRLLQEPSGRQGRQEISTHGAGEGGQPGRNVDPEGIPGKGAEHGGFLQGAWALVGSGQGRFGRRYEEHLNTGDGGMHLSDSYASVVGGEHLHLHLHL